MGTAILRTAVAPITIVTYVISIITDAVRQYATDHCGTYAAAIAYYTLFSMVPLALVIVSILGLIVEPARVVDFLFDLFPLEESVEVRTDIQVAVEDARAASPGVLVISTAILVWSASGVFGAVRRGISVAAGGRGQPYLHGKLLDITLVPAIGLTILLGLGLLTGVQIAIQEFQRIGPGADWQLVLLSHLAVAFITFGAFALLYRLLPEQRPGWREALWAAGVTAMLLEVAKTSVGYAISHAPFVANNPLYASIGTALTLLFWVFVAASIVLFGAEVGRRISRPPAGQVTGDGERARLEEAGWEI